MKPLTPREEEVVAYLLKGYTDKEIGEVLGIAVPTAKMHVKNISAKMEIATNRSKIVTLTLTKRLEHIQQGDIAQIRIGINKLVKDMRV